MSTTITAKQEYRTEQRRQRFARFCKQLDEERGEGLLFSVIYSFDVDGETDIRQFNPPELRLWELTEDDSSYEFDYLADESGNEAYRNGRHRKFCALLNRQQFDRFTSELELAAQNVLTMGSIGAPGFGFGWAPAISFDRDSSYGDPIWCNAYVTPYSPSWSEDNLPDWERLRQAVVNVYGYGEDESALDEFDPNSEAFAYPRKFDPLQTAFAFVSDTNN